MKKIVIIASLIIVLIIGLILTLKKENKEENIKPKELLIQNEKIEIINDEVFIEATLTNKNKESIQLDNVDIILLNQNKEVLKIKSEVNKTLKQNESIKISSQTKAGLNNYENYHLKIKY